MDLLNHNISSRQDIPDEIKKWNWGAFLLNGMWAFSHKLDFWGTLCFLPGINFIAMFILGFKGNQLAWKKNRYPDINTFLQLQAYWEKWGFRLWGISAGIGMLAVLLT